MAGGFLPPGDEQRDPFGDEDRPARTREFGAPVPPPPPPPPHAMPPPAPVAGETDNGFAIASLALGIIGLVVLVASLGIVVVNLPCSIAAWLLGREGVARVDRGERAGQRALAETGRVLGIVGTVLGVIAAALWVVLLLWLDANLPGGL